MSELSSLFKVELYLVGFNIYDERGTVMNAVIGTKTPGRRQVYIHKTLEGEEARKLYELIRDENSQ